MDSDVGFAVIILTPDDIGNLKAEESQPRARQNVLLELGYFIGKLTRKRVCTLKVGELEIPSDWRGVVDEPYDASGGLSLDPRSSNFPRGETGVEFDRLRDR